MSTQFRDPVGTGLAAVVGVLAGLALAAPMLPRRLPVGGGEVTLSPVAAYLLASALAVVAIPVGMVVLYLAFLELD